MLGFALLLLHASPGLNLAASQPRPAFVDGFATITIAVDRPVSLSDLGSSAKFWVNGASIPVTKITPREVATHTGTITPDMVVLPGTIQGALGGRDWDPAGAITQMTPTGNGAYEFITALPAGTYEYKLAKGGNWNENFGAGFTPGGGNITLKITKDGTVVKFVVDFQKKLILDSVNQPDKVKAPAVAPPNPNKPDPSKELYNSFSLTLSRPLKEGELALPLRAQIGNDAARQVFARNVLNEPNFRYKNEDLGNRWSPRATWFKVWSPISKGVTLNLELPGRQPKALPMVRGRGGVWYIRVDQNLHQARYTYTFDSYGERRTAPDIYCRAATPDSAKSVVLDLRATNPKGWPAPTVFVGKKPSDAVLYEAHVRDLTVHPSSGVKPAWRGKYMGLTQAGTRTKEGLPTGLDYLRSTGATHIHLLPFQNFNPGNSHVYNWGYETNLFDVPEEQYSTNPADPGTTIRECKSMIQALQRSGMGVVLDVVYNHSVPSEGPGSAFWQAAPYYYFRTNDRGDVLNESGVGNALNDDQFMVRKYIIDSLVYWTNEYKLDGFRFDLVGMFTKQTVQELTERLRGIRPNMVLYGEPWTGGGPVRFSKGAQKGIGFAVFNDHFRNAIRGELDGPGAGFGMGNISNLAAVRSGIEGSIHDFAEHPNESVNYVSAHDNMTLLDKILASTPNADHATQVRQLKFIGSVVLFSQGIPFLEGGAEIGRTKGGSTNSYNGGDALNQYDWSRMHEYADALAAYREMISVRKAHPAFRAADRGTVSKILRFLPDHQIPTGTVAYTLNGSLVGDSWKNILVVHVGGKEAVEFQFPTPGWKLGYCTELGTKIVGQKIKLKSQTTLVAYQ